MKKNYIAPELDIQMIEMINPIQASIVLGGDEEYADPSLNSEAKSVDIAGDLFDF